MKNFYAMLMSTMDSYRAHMAFLLKIIVSPSQRKHVYRWLISLRHNYLPDASIPWITFDAIDYLDWCLFTRAKVFEYGSGGSTLFWLNHGAECISIEHNPDWYKLMHPRLEEMDRIDYRLVLPEPALDKGARDIADPNRYLSEDVLFLGYNFRDYVCQIDPFPDNYFDVVLIDGRARPSCIKHACEKVRIGGLLVLDNSDREYYLRITAILLQNFDRRIFPGVAPIVTWFTETSVFSRRA
jgi:hypothetical protein